ncbi:MAG: tRNA pseudouridine(38-40) synthase TruA, partial [Candidatus Marinimicrobia bacterium CG_4_9_14_3_um_filter_48_9]
MLRIALLIEYEGTKYSGWQSQPNGVTIQSTLEQALEKVTQQTVRILGSGRTDAGVHAAGQVAHLDLMRDLSMPIERFPGAINTQLPNSIRVLTAQVVPAQFNAR